jgi:hypothetical protein
MLSGLQHSYSRRHRRRLKREAEAIGSNIRSTEVPIVSLESIASQFQLWTPDLLSVDVEGAELDVLKSADWSRFRPAVVVVESNYGISAITRFMRSNKYILLFKIGCDRVFASSKMLTVAG